MATVSFSLESSREQEESCADIADAWRTLSMTAPKMPFSDQRVLDERNDRAARTSSAESKGESCRYSSHEHSNYTVKYL